MPQRWFNNGSELSDGDPEERPYESKPSIVFVRCNSNVVYSTFRDKVKNMGDAIYGAFDPDDGKRSNLIQGE
jgi:hypothetical protein